eukprot:COSAG02_NODE_27638_length_605_cov_1.079051_1_plen_78_part_00
MQQKEEEGEGEGQEQEEQKPEPKEPKEPEQPEREGQGQIVPAGGAVIATGSRITQTCTSVRARRSSNQVRAALESYD